MPTLRSAFPSVHVQDIDDYNDSMPGAELCRRVVVIDEFQDLVLSKALRPAFEEAVQRLGAKARAAGIHLILATQRPDAKTVRPGIEANIPGKIALKVQSPVNSRIILSEGGAEALLGRGDMLGHHLKSFRASPRKSPLRAHAIPREGKSAWCMVVAHPPARAGDRCASMASFHRHARRSTRRHGRSPAPHH